ncbi:MAG TPA: response regulator [Rhodospirillaceae bacterium]|nr:response regulator [Rhodospirillaceae bacterium]
MSYNFGRLSVLVVEDTVPMRKLICSVLETMGVGSVHTAENGQQGYERFCKERPDIVITDWHMEPVNGLELVEKIRGNSDSPNRTVPIVMMTGYSSMPRVSSARDRGATEFLVKPFSASDLTKRIAHVINKPRDFVELEGYFGPDRRRRAIENYSGPLRRATDLI